MMLKVQKTIAMMAFVIKSIIRRLTVTLQHHSTFISTKERTQTGQLREDTYHCYAPIF